MKKEAIENIQRALESNNMENVNEVVRIVLKDEIRNIKAKELVLTRLSKAFDKMTVPLKIELSYPKESNKRERALITLTLLWLVACMIISAIARTSFIGAIVISLIFASATFLLYRDKTKRESFESEIIIKSEAGDIVSQIQDVAHHLKEALAEAEPDVNPSAPQPHSLYDSFPNVVRWLQNQYIDSDELGKNSQIRMRKSIKVLLDQCYYDIIDYDGTNIEMFKKEYSSHISETTQLEPTIIDTKTQTIVIKGSVLLPDSIINK